MSTFQSELRSQAAAALDATPDLPHTWDGVDGEVTLTFPRTSTQGFDVVLSASAIGLILYAGSMHVPFDDLDCPGESVREALALTRDLLSPAMRLRELRIFGFSYRWYLEHNDGTKWEIEHEMGLLFWAPRFLASQTIYRNSQLPSR